MPTQANAETLQIVIQQDLTGCGLACVAMLANQSYAQVRDTASRLGIFAEDRQLWSDTAHIRRLLAHFDIKTADQKSPFHSWDGLPDRALLAIKWRLVKAAPCWHWVVFCRERTGAVVLDPKAALVNNRRSDFGRMRPKWFIALLP